MKTKLILSLTLGALTLSACEIRLEGNGDFYPNTPASFNGNWVSNCSSISPSAILLTQDALAGSDRFFARTLGSTNGSKHSMSVLGDEITYKMASFDTSNCEDLQFTLRAYLSYSLYSQSAYNNNYDIDLRYEGVTMTAETTEVASIFNASAFCGSETWEAGIPKDITGRNCSGERINNLGDRYYSTLELGTDTVYFDIANKSLYEMDRPLSAGLKSFIRY